MKVRNSSHNTVKGKTKFEHQYNFVNFSKCSDVNCKDRYIGETDRRITERITDQNKRDKNSETFLWK